MASIAPRAWAIACWSAVRASDGSPPSRIAASKASAASATWNAPIARADPFSVCASSAASAGSAASALDQPNGLPCEHRQHLALQPGIAKRHALADVRYRWDRHRERAAAMASS